MEINTKEVASKLKKLRQALNMPVVDFAEKLGYEGVSTYHNIETGKGRITIDFINNVAKTFKVSSSYLLGFENEQDVNRDKRISILEKELTEKSQSLQNAQQLYSTSQEQLNAIAYAIYIAVFRQDLLPKYGYADRDPLAFFVLYKSIEEVREKISDQELGKILELRNKLAAENVIFAQNRINRTMPPTASAALNPLVEKIAQPIKKEDINVSMLYSTVNDFLKQNPESGALSLLYLSKSFLINHIDYQKLPPPPHDYVNLSTHILRFVI